MVGGEAEDGGGYEVAVICSGSADGRGGFIAIGGCASDV